MKMNECKGCKHEKNKTVSYCGHCDRSYEGVDKGFYSDRYETEEPKELSDTWKQQTMSRFERVE